MPGFFDRFLKRWSATGIVAEPTAIQHDTGFSYLGANPPTVEQFNALFQNLDDKDNWLYNQLLAVMAAGGQTPTATNAQTTLAALRNLFQPSLLAFGASQAWIVPTGVTRVHVRMWGGGGGGGGSFGPFSAGSGGGAGGYCEGVFSVSPGASIFITVGAQGLGSRSLEIYTATSGGTTSFGSFASASGGGAGNGGLNAISFVSAALSSAFGGLINLPGGGGGFGQIYDNGATGGGIGGPAPLGGAPSYLSLGGNGNGGVFPGGGGTGAGMRANAGASDSYGGGTGAPGFVIIDW